MDERTITDRVTDQYREHLVERGGFIVLQGRLRGLWWYVFGLQAAVVILFCWVWWDLHAQAEQIDYLQTRVEILEEIGGVGP